MKTYKVKHNSRRNSRRKNHTRKHWRHIGGSSPDGKVQLSEKQKPTRRMSFFGKPPSISLRRSMILQKDTGDNEEEFVFAVRRPNTKPHKTTNKIRDAIIVGDEDIKSYANASDSTRKKAASVISSAIVNSKIIDKGFLKKECIDSNVCMGFGQHRQKIIKYFDGFTPFNYVDDSSIKMLGNPSVNGFIIEIKYTRHEWRIFQRNGYSAYTILKSARDPKSDNLAYEYIVGKFINKQCARFPCFLQTYGLYYYKDNSSWSFFNDKNNTITKNILTNKLELQPDNPIDFPKICAKSQHAAILIEHIKNAKSLQDMILQRDSFKKLLFNTHELIYILYQVYMPLAQLQDVFTHYDLHSLNVQLYEPDPGNYIEYHYHISSTIVVTFKSRYIVKIIDYGRSFFSYGTSSKRNPKNFFNQLCETKECNRMKKDKIVSSCGEDMGLAFLYPDFSEDYFFISSSLSNPSHDLRLLTQVYSLLKLTDTISYIRHEGHKKTYQDRFKSLEGMFKKVVYGEGMSRPEDKQFGTKPNNNRGYPSKINNVRDAEEAIRNIINMDKFKQMNDHDFSHVNTYKIGDMHIYSNGEPMEFIKA